MQTGAICRILGVLLMIFSLSMLPPIGVAFWYHDGAVDAFYIAFALTLATGLVLWFFARNQRQDLKTRDGFIIVVLFWTVLSLFGALPFIFGDRPYVTFTDGFFESVSGLTTTGATIFVTVDPLPHALLYYRQQLQFLGGMGIIVLAVAILPMLGVGGMQLFRAETPGPVKDTKLTPRIAETAKTLWYIYVGLTVACIISYWLGGMPLFYAIGDAFATISTGGFAMHGGSLSYFNSMSIDVIASVFMVLGAVNFGLHYLFLQTRSLTSYWHDQELRGFLLLLLVVSSIVIGALIYHHTYPDTLTAVVKSIFTVISLATTTGFTSGNFDQWASFVPFLIMITALIGGCAASTSGGIKIVRVLLLFKQGHREFKRLLHPSAVLPIKFGNHVLPEHVIQSIWAYVGLFIVSFVVMFLLLLAGGLDLRTAFGALVASISNSGAAIGGVSSTYHYLNTFCKWVLIVGMLLGRLEFFTLLILFTNVFWRR